MVEAINILKSLFQQRASPPHDGSGDGGAEGAASDDIRVVVMIIEGSRNRDTGGAKQRGEHDQQGRGLRAHAWVRQAQSEGQKDGEEDGGGEAERRMAAGEGLPGLPDGGGVAGAEVLRVRSIRDADGGEVRARAAGQELENVGEEDGYDGCFEEGEGEEC